jgi:hypothetical protein
MSKSNGYAIIGIDPGLMTGLYVYRSDADWSLLRTSGPMQVSAEKVPVRVHNLLIEAGLDGYTVLIAVEKYIITARTAKLSQQSEALEVTGMVKAVATLLGSRDVRQYLKSNLKFASDDMLRTMGWFTPNMRHANDAARQASALLKEVDYPRWCELVKGGTLDTTTNEG